MLMGLRHMHQGQADPLQEHKHKLQLCTGRASLQLAVLPCQERCTVHFKNLAALIFFLMEQVNAVGEILQQNLKVSHFTITQLIKGCPQTYAD